MRRQRAVGRSLSLACASWSLAAILLAAQPAAAWQPTKPVEFVIPAGTGGGADQMARLISGIVEKHKLSPQPIIAINKSGGAGAEGFLYVKEKKGDAHTIVTTAAERIRITGYTSRTPRGTSVCRRARGSFLNSCARRRSSG